MGLGHQFGFPGCVHNLLERLTRGHRAAHVNPAWGTAPTVGAPSSCNPGLTAQAGCSGSVRGEAEGGGTVFALHSAEAQVREDGEPGWPVGSRPLQPENQAA